MLTLAAVLVGAAMAVGFYAWGMRDGRRLGQDEQADEWLRAGLDAPDFVEAAWPVARGREGRLLQ